MFFVYESIFGQKIEKYELFFDEINIEKQSIKAEAILNFVIDKPTKEINLLLDNNLTISKIKYQEKSLKFLRQENQLKILFNKNLPIGNDIQKISISYYGNPPKDNYWGGVFFLKNEMFSMGVGMASNPHGVGRFLYPTYDDFCSKSLYEINVVVPNNLSAVCSGIQTKSPYKNRCKDSNYKEVHYSIQNPISSYLVAIAVGDYKEYQDKYKNIRLVINSLSKNQDAIDYYFDVMKTTMSMMEYYFGACKFKQTGLVEVDFNQGAMEHAENISFPKEYFWEGKYNEKTLSHEISHSWFGNLVTAKNNQDMWLNEGWASFCALLYLDYKYGNATFLDEIKVDKLNLFWYYNKKYTSQNYPIYTNNPSLTYGNNIYQKGKFAVLALKYYLGDEIFYSAIKKYLETYSFKNVSIEEFIDFMNKETRINLNNFFDYHLYKKQYTHYYISNYKIDENNNCSFGIKQNNFCYQNKVRVLFMDEKFNTFDQTYYFDNIDTTINVKLDFKPTIKIIDPDNYCLDSKVNCQQIVNQKGDNLYQFSTSEPTYRKYLEYRALSKDSIFINFEVGYHNSLVNHIYVQTNKPEVSQNDKLILYFDRNPKGKLYYKENFDDQYKEVTNFKRVNNDYFDSWLIDFKAGIYIEK